MSGIWIRGKEIGKNHPCYIIAEAGVNHNGDIRLAKKLVKAAAGSGADAVKFQTFTADSIATKTAGKAAYQKKTSDASESQYDMLKRLELSKNAFLELSDYAKKNGIEFLSSPFDCKSAELLESIGVAAYKIPSGEITNIPLLEQIGSYKKPVILSTGMAEMTEIREGISAIRRGGGKEIILLHCVTSYPAPLESANLMMIPALAKTFRIPVGFSDHTQGIVASLLARALGACVIEKHFTLDRSLPGPDHTASLEPSELSELVAQIRMTETALGDGIKHIDRHEAAIRELVRKSLVAATAIPEGVRITRDMLDMKRPGTGIGTKDLRLVIGKRTRLPVAKDDILQWDMLE
ncbi:N-acetylneuraminate synthase [Methanoregula sp.]|uniref:N-acetylneuraminate synthase n=1 Tax=Methanoregula sp. TaxID=2052170 RepID=UPI003C71BEAD